MRGEVGLCEMVFSEEGIEVWVLLWLWGIDMF